MGQGRGIGQKLILVVGLGWGLGHLLEGGFWSYKAHDR